MATTEPFTGDELRVSAHSHSTDGINYFPAFIMNRQLYVIPRARACVSHDDAKLVAEGRLRDLHVFLNMTFMFWGLDKLA